MIKNNSTLLVLSGPSGAGKGSITKILVSTGEYKVSVSATTRRKRPEEVHGEHYFFLDRESFEAKIAAGDFLEWKNVHGNLYGTLSSEVSRLVENGFIPILEIDVQGAFEVAKVYPNVCFVFLKTPSLKILGERLRGRGTETEEEVVRRLAAAKHEIAWAGSSKLFQTVVNRDRRIAAAVKIDAAVLKVYRKLESR